MDEDIKLIDNIIYASGKKQEVDNRGVGWVFYESLLKNKDKLAQIDGLTGEKDTFGSLLQRCVRAAIGLKLKGIGYGDIISTCTYNHLNSCVPHISSFFAGAILAALDPSMSLSSALHVFKITKPKLVFVGEESVKLIEDVIAEIGCKTIIVVFGQTKKYIPFDDFAKPSIEEVQFKPCTVKNIKDVANIMFSSGTTGLPKAICHTHFAILNQDSANLKFGTMGSIIFSSDSPYWNVFLFYLNYSIQSGATRMLYPKFDFNDPWKIFSRNITLAFLNLTEIMVLCHTPKPTHIDTSGLKLISTGGGAASVQHIAKAKSCFPGTLVRVSYGQSEVYGSILCFDMGNAKHLDYLKAKPNSCGLPNSGFCYKIVDVETDEVLGPNQSGQLLVKSDNQLRGYYNMDSKDIWDEDGWLKTGDYGYYDEDFCFYMTDRVKEMFKYRYWHIVPQILETILETHPAVLKAVVIGKPHEIDDSHPMALIRLHANTHATEEEIVKYLEERVEDRERLRGGVKFVNDFPLTSSRKINRWKLKQMFFKGENN